MKILMLFTYLIFSGNLLSQELGTESIEVNKIIRESMEKTCNAKHFEIKQKIDKLMSKFSKVELLLYYDFEESKMQESLISQKESIDFTVVMLMLKDPKVLEIKKEIGQMYQQYYRATEHLEKDVIRSALNKILKVFSEGYLERTYGRMYKGIVSNYNGFSYHANFESGETDLVDSLYLGPLAFNIRDDQVINRININTTIDSYGNYYQGYIENGSGSNVFSLKVDGDRSDERIQKIVEIFNNGHVGSNQFRGVPINSNWILLKSLRKDLRFCEEKFSEYIDDSRKTNWVDPKKRLKEEIIINRKQPQKR